MPVLRSQSPADLPLKLVFLTVLAAVTWLSLAAGAPPPPPGISDKIKHTSAYTVLGITGLLAFSKHPGRLAGFLLGWGILMEIGQKFVPGRSPEAADVLANLLGIALAWFVMRTWLRNRQAPSA
jgi:VanZ family protein